MIIYRKNKNVNFKHARGKKGVLGRMFHDYYEIFLLLNGDVEFIRDRIRQKITPLQLVVIPAGEYQLDSQGKIIPDSFSLTESNTRLPVYRWITAPVEALLFGSGSFNIIQIIAVLLILGGSFKLLDATGGLYAIVQVIINKFYNKRFKLMPQLLTITLSKGCKF